MQLKQCPTSQSTESSVWLSAECRVTDHQRGGWLQRRRVGWLLARSLAREVKLGGVTTLGDAAAAAEDDRHSDPFLTHPFKYQILFNFHIHPIHTPWCYIYPRWHF